MATFVIAAIVAAGAIAWPTQSGGSRAKADPTAPTTTTTRPPEPKHELRAFRNANGRLRFSQDDVCGLIDAKEIRRIFKQTKTPYINQPPERWYSTCQWDLPGTALYLSVTEAEPGGSPKDDLLGTYIDFTIQHPDECRTLEADVDVDPCWRVSAIPALGDEAWMTTWTSITKDGKAQLPWIPDDMVVVANGVQILIQPWGASYEDAVEQATELARLIVSRLPDQVTMVPACPPKAEDC